MYFCNMNPVASATYYLRYLATARGRHGVHSPFMYAITDRVLHGQEVPAIPIERIRDSMRSSREVISVTDYGAGHNGKAYPREVRMIARCSGITRRHGQLLYRLARHLEPESVLELGTSLGFGTMYLAAGAPNASIVTLEGCPATAAIAEANFREAGLTNIELITGPFEDTLDKVLEGDFRPGLVFFDGNHTRDATLRYFRRCISRRGEKAAFVFDDINWSHGMREAWNEVRSEPLVSATADLFRLGIAFFDPGLQKEDFVLRY